MLFFHGGNAATGLAALTVGCPVSQSSGYALSTRSIQDARIECAIPGANGKSTTFVSGDIGCTIPNPESERRVFTSVLPPPELSIVTTLSLPGEADPNIYAC
jgi:hypothetical protein